MGTTIFPLISLFDMNGDFIASDDGTNATNFVQAQLTGTPPFMPTPFSGEVNGETFTTGPGGDALIQQTLAPGSYTLRIESQGTLGLFRSHAVHASP